MFFLFGSRARGSVCRRWGENREEVLEGVGRGGVYVALCGGAWQYGIKKGGFGGLLSLFGEAPCVFPRMSGQWEERGADGCSFRMRYDLLEALPGPAPALSCAGL